MQKSINYSNIDYVADLWRYIKPYKGKFWAGVFFRLTSDIAKLYPAIAISQVIEILSQNNADLNLNRLYLIFILWGIDAAYFSFFHNYSKYLDIQVAEYAALDFYKKALSHVFKLDLSWQEKENSGNKMKRIDKGSDGITITIRKVLNVLIEVFVNLVGVTLIFFSVNKTLSASILFYIVVFFVIGTYRLRKAINQERVVSKSFENLEGITFESLNNILTIKSLDIDTGVMKIIGRQVESIIPKIKKRIYYYQTLYGLTNTFENFYKYVVIFFLSVGVIHGSNDLSLLVLFITLFGRVDTSVAELTDVVQELATAKIWVSRAMFILNTEPKIENPELLKKQIIYPESWTELKIINVRFAYKKNQAISDISFTVKRNEKVGIVGLSGAGKSTLFKLFLDLYENYKGDIFLDKLSIKNIKRQSYIDHVAVVLQDTELFNMSLKDNIEIASGKNKKDGELLNDVVKMAHLEDVVAKLPQGVNTIVGEKGIKLSGGQRQRLGIARALYRSPDILLLDEATSHLDAHSEKEIQKAILENVHKFTTIVIAHRLSTIKAMDKIIVLENGRVVEQGGFDVLLAKNGVFAKMWQDQKI